MPNYKLIIEYDGRNFNGWQKQRHTKETIQEYLESAIEILVREKITLYAAGRTDAGVSAFNQSANFKAETKIPDKTKFLYSLNSILPDSITVKSIKNVSPDFHARYSARKREYLYFVTREKRSIGGDFFYNYNYDLDFSKIDDFIGFIKQLEYFKTLCKNKEDSHNFGSIIYDFDYKIKRAGKEIIFRISANRFLHSMVRSILGCTLEIGSSKKNTDETKKSILKGDKIRIYYLPSNALFLNKILY
ncbi:MAG: tRNA pseudouridine(38-40) synthase TruA [Bacteroidetes bacterium]|nr:tRNA pseudouridine(38-40) synthase TruA [Bacteroidota bacterium]